MSHLQGVVFIAVLCAVNAAVTVNVYEDDVETIGTNKAHDVESCNTEGCERICQLLGFNVGVCVGDRCECMKSHKDDDQLKQNNIPSLGEGVSEKELGGCDPNACYQLCRRLKFPSGTCINGRCKCDNFRPEPEQLEQNDVLLNSLDEGVSEIGLGGCDPNACYQLCRRLKFPSGTCINGRCKCDNFRLEPEAMVNGVPDQVQAGCNNAACSTLCHILGYRYGVCSNSNTCECSNILKTDEAMVNGVPDQVQAGCNNAACSTRCHILGYRYGVCLNSNTCKCSNVLRPDVLEISLDQGTNEYIANAVKPDVDTVVTKAVRDCDQLACMMGCLELGAPGGSCFLGKCRCNNRDKENENLRSSQAKTCNNVNCYFMCRRWGYIGGSCRGDSCVCV